METGFAVMKKGNLWTLRMRGSETAGTFGSLQACMQCAYHLTDAHLALDDDLEVDARLRWSACWKRVGAARLGTSNARHCFWSVHKKCVVETEETEQQADRRKQRPQNGKRPSRITH